ncbi:MAG: hypothetical protein J0I80_03990 [Sphingomonas sp.]|nr:hypothetical protein [Sphingomonas sp.]
MTNISPIRPATALQPLTDDAIVRALIADELDRIRTVLEDMGTRLCADPEIVGSHLYALQAIDEICQRNENLARTLRADDMVAQSAAITLESLRLRLQTALSERLTRHEDGPAAAASSD